jgi:hypothetical protein
MSVSDKGWPSLLYLGAGLSLVAVAILMIFVIPAFKEVIIPGSEWILIGIQLVITGLIFCVGYINKREGCLTRIMLVILGISVIFLGLLGFIAPAMESEQTLVWKTATRICAIDEIVIGIIAFYACI